MSVRSELDKIKGDSVHLCERATLQDDVHRGVAVREGYPTDAASQPRLRIYPVRKHRFKPKLYLRYVCQNVPHVRHILPGVGSVHGGLRVLGDFLHCEEQQHRRH